MNVTKNFIAIILGFVLVNICPIAQAEDGYELWLRYKKIEDTKIAASYLKQIKGWIVDDTSATAAVTRAEIKNGLEGLLGQSFPESRAIGEGVVIAGTILSPTLSGILRNENLGREGYAIRNISVKGKKNIVIIGGDAIGMLYGVFHFLRLLQTHQQIDTLSIKESPKVQLRVLNHWDNLDRTVERGYAGFSLWDWHKLPDYLDPRYTDYARANASIGINGTVLTNVNANALVLTPAYLKKVAALANVFRPYGIKVYLTARFSAPIEIGGLKTADPLSEEVRQWWRSKATEIYKYIPDFGGFVVKANSEGQPGPQKYERSHADGANMLADALKPFGGNVMWRAFVYDNNVREDRAKQAYSEFKPLDGTFRANVMVQVKNGPIDFQPREPFHPLFGAMPATALMPEFQITQEYLGFATHLVFLAPLFKECLDAETFFKGQGSTVARLIDGSLQSQPLTGIAGVANIGNERNWCGHPFAQANWFAFGRLAWNHSLSSSNIAEEWIRMTWGNDKDVVERSRNIMLASREAIVNYMTPIGLHHIMGWDHHYGPAPWIKDKPRADWTSVYYHQADDKGIGFDRTASGSNALSQYHENVVKKFGSVDTCPDEYLLWFHHASWDHRMHSGRTLWDELCYRYDHGTDTVQWMQQEWSLLKDKIDSSRFKHVQELLNIQYKEANWWRNACLLYFQTFSNKRFPNGFRMPDQTLEYYQQLEFPFAPGIRPKW